MTGSRCSVVVVLLALLTPGRSKQVSMTMPGGNPTYEDAYLCTSFPTKDLLPLDSEQKSYITKFTPQADAKIAHHMLLHSCNRPVKTKGLIYDCLSNPVCLDHSNIHFGWAKNADEMKMPPDVSLSIDTKKIKYFVLQVHYVKPLDSPDNETTLKLDASVKRSKYDASIMVLLRSWISIPPRTPVYHGEVNCMVGKAIIPFAFRTHSHNYGVVTTGYKYSKKTGKMTEFARGNPQWPQAFYPVKNKVVFEPGDYAIARCTYNTSSTDQTIHIGAKHDQEMCNLYVMYYLEDGKANFKECLNEADPSITKLLPEDSDKPLPPNPELEKAALHKKKSDQHITLTMPGALPKAPDSYLCSAYDTRKWGHDLPVFIKKFSVETTAKKVHHLIIQSCDQPSGGEGKVWGCMHHGTCNGRTKILYAWAKDAPPANIPNDVGFMIDQQYPYLVLQVHYKYPLKKRDYASVTLTYTTEEPKYLAGIYLMLNNFGRFPPHQPKVYSDMNCEVSGLESPLTVFAFRTHAHTHGRVISGYKVNGDQYEEIAKGDPQLPQAFYPTKERKVIKNGDWLAGRCTFSTMDENSTVSIGFTGGDEMCNLYLMFYTISRNNDQTFRICEGENDKEMSRNLPANSDVITPGEEPISYTNGKKPESTMDPKKKKQFFSGGSKKPDKAYYQVNNWPPQESKAKIGQPAGIAIDIYGNPTILHRGNRIWEANTFNWDNSYALDRTKPIPNNTVITLDGTGTPINSWGADTFFLPHMITIDAQNNFWITDVALHQVFKFEPYGGPTKKAVVALGERFVPGSDDMHYCKPTSVAVAQDGKSFFVSDGYCNSRIIKYSLRIDNTGYHNVTKLFSWGKANSAGFALSRSPYSMNVPHGLALAENKGLICVADRENGRIQCYRSSDANFVKSIQLKEFSSTIYGIDYNAKDGMLFAVSGPEALGALTGKKAQGYKIDLEREELVEIFNAGGSGLQMPHDIAVSVNGTEIYVVDLQPFNVIKLSYGSSVTTNTIPTNEIPTNNKEATSNVDNKPGKVIDKLQKFIPSSNIGIITAIISLSITLLCTLCLVFTRCRKRGRGKRVPKRDRGKLDLGDLLGRSKEGFRPLNTQDDGETLSSESDLEDFNAHSRKA